MSEHHVVTIATATGALAEEAGSLLAHELGFRYINEQIIDRAAQQAGVARDEIDRAEHTQPLLTRVMSVLASAAAPQAAEWAWDPDIRYEDPSPAYRRLIKDVIEQVAIEGDAVIVAHGAGMRLSGMAGLLRVFVTASPAVRAQRVAGERSCSPADAALIVERADKEREAYLRRFYGVRHELPTHYDLVVNTDVLSAEIAARVIAQAVSLKPVGRV